MKSIVLKGGQLSKSKMIGREVKKNLPLFAMLLPGTLFTILFCYLPMFGIIISFKKYSPIDGVFGSPWCGLQNFKFLFNSSDTWIMLRNTLGYNLLFIFLGTAISVSLAILLNSIRNKLLSKMYQTVLIMPHFLSMVVVACIVYGFFSVETGYVNTRILSGLGIEPVNWFVNKEPWPYILSTVHFWKVFGYGSIVYLAGIAGIDTSLYEAATVDGASRWKQVWYITLPSLKPIIVIQLILSIGKILNADFGLFYQVPQNSGALRDVTLVINTFTYGMLGKGGITGIGMSSAACFFQSVVGFILVVATNMFVRKIDSESAVF